MEEVSVAARLLITSDALYGDFFRAGLLLCSVADLRTVGDIGTARILGEVVPLEGRRPPLLRYRAAEVSWFLVCLGRPARHLCTDF